MTAPPRQFRTALITGMSGSGGSYMAEHVVRHHPEVAVVGTARTADSPLRNLADVAPAVSVRACELTDLAAVSALVRAVNPDVVFHLAADADVRASFDTPLAVLHNNVLATANLFEAVRTAGIDPIVQLCSTSEVYGQVAADDVPIGEDQPMRPVSPYSVSKAAQDQLGIAYHRAYGLRIVRTRMFAYLNPRRDDLAATAFALQVARIEAGQQEELRHGNLESIRTFLDVRDAMEAYWMAAEYCEPGQAYNIGGDTTMSIGRLLELLMEKARVPITTREDPALLRPVDVTLQIPDTGRFLRATAWRPRHTFAESVEHLLDHARRTVAAEAKEETAGAGRRRAMGEPR